MTRLTYPAYHMTARQVAAVFDAAGLEISLERAKEISLELGAGGHKPADYIRAASDATGIATADILRCNIMILRQGLEFDTGDRRKAGEEKLARMEAQLARLEARRSQGMITGPWVVTAIREGWTV